MTFREILQKFRSESHISRRCGLKPQRRRKDGELWQGIPFNIKTS